jgi:glyoxylase-like metal-dependent hydrolase (beta-lactamase superfamily II)
MRTKIALIAVASLLFSALWAGAEEISGLPLHLQRLGPDTVRLWLGDSVSTTSIVAFATEKGIVVVDTFGVPEVDTQLRRVIARELGRSDFRVLINTHEHGDHTGGNSVYSDCTIVGHELVAQGMQRAAGDRERLLDLYPEWIADLENRFEELDPESPEAADVRERLILRRMNFENVSANEAPIFPTTTFSDRMALDMGDTTFELSFIGGMHSSSDIAVFVPERGLLLTGDVMADVWLTETAGCLASFSVRPGIYHDFPLLLANWDRLLEQGDSITLLLPGHWNGELSFDGAKARVEYVRTLWNGVTEAAAADRNLEDVQAEYALATRFPDLVDSPGFDPARHYGSVTEMWTVVSRQQSAARVIYTLLDESAQQTAVDDVVADHDSPSPDHFFIESEFNAYGYALLQRDKVDEAITMFRINVELFPDSWNVYDSLGEALLRAGKTDEGIAMYERSLAINPDNTNGTEVLSRVREKLATS